MEIKFDYPPNITDIRKVLPIDSGKMIYCWGDILYNPHKLEIADHLKIHELTHSRQQIVPEVWWKRYLEDKDFRLSQELEAYQEQYKFAKNWIKDRNLLSRFLWAIARDLSSELYGNIIEFEEAKKQIKNVR